MQQGNLPSGEMGLRAQVALCAAQGSKRRGLSCGEPHGAHTDLAARGETPAAFGALGATLDFHHGLLRELRLACSAIYC
jgi:hypothetical protein